MNPVAFTEEEGAPMEVATLALWLFVSAVSVVGLTVGYQRPLAPVKKMPAVVAEVVQVELTTDPIEAPMAPSQELAAPPQIEQPAALQPPNTPQLTAVAEPSLVAFALPVDGPVVVVKTPQQAAYVAPVVEPAPAAPAPVAAAPQRLVHGQGEGRQPAPDYPYRARREGQEGSVTVQFSVGENGQVLAAEAAAPSPWPLLNEAAVKVIRERWRFRTGAFRAFEVTIHFKLR